MSGYEESDMQTEFAPKARQIRSLYKVIKVGFLILLVPCIAPIFFELIETPLYVQMILVGGGAIISLILGSPAIWIRYCTKCPKCSGRLFLDESRSFQMTGKCGFCGTKLHEDGDVTGWGKYFR